jgi:hypothetical protein
MKALIASELLILVAAIILLVLGFKNAAWMVGSPGMALLLLFWLLYVSIFHSRKRWPGTTWTTRLAKVMSFER